MRINKSPLDHFSERSKPTRFIVLHSCYSVKSANFFCYESIIKELDNLKLSYHYLISRSGLVYELVPPEKKAWHAGDSFFPEFNERGLNDSSVGISLVATETSGYTPFQIASLVQLLGHLKMLFPEIRAITSHSHIAPDRKSDPWGFDWHKLKKQIKSLSLQLFP